MLFKAVINSVLLSSIVYAPMVYAYSIQSTQLIELTDRELSQVEAQALLSMTYIAPKDSSNNMIGQGVGFYKLGFDTMMEINANIRKLQLGCGGINGPGGCDIDIDNLSLSGNSDTREGRASSSAEITNPFVEFAIKNPDSSAQREVLGVRFSAEALKGLLTFGEENSATPNGLNSFSGYMRIKDAAGRASTAKRNMTYGDTNMSIDGRAKIGDRGPTTGFSSKDYNLQLASAGADLKINGQTISGTRMTSATLNGVANIQSLAFGGNMKANLKVTGGLMALERKLSGDITGLTANVTLEQNLGFIHKIPLNNPVSLSLQSQQVFWPGADAAAKKGWWLAFDDEIDIGDITPTNQIEITDNVLKQIVPPLSSYLTKNPIQCSVISCVLLGKAIEVGNINLPTAVINFPLKDLQLAKQNFAPNCYGSLKFC